MCFIAALLIPLCRRLMVSNRGLFRLWHWQSDPLTTRLDNIHSVKHKVHTYKEYHSVCPSSELGLPTTPHPQASVPPPPCFWYSLYVRTLCSEILLLSVKSACTLLKYILSLSTRIYWTLFSLDLEEPQASPVQALAIFTKVSTLQILY